MSKRSPGITGVIQQVNECEQRIDETENMSNRAMEMVANLKTTLVFMQDQAKADALKVVKAQEKTDYLEKQLREMTGGASDIAAFMKKMATERNSVRSKLETNHHHIKKVGDVVDNTQEKHGKILEDLVKRTILTEKKQ